jgi:hypothetical protein
MGFIDGSQLNVRLQSAWVHGCDLFARFSHFLLFLFLLFVLFLKPWCLHSNLNLFSFFNYESNLGDSNSGPGFII